MSRDKKTDEGVRPHQMSAKRQNPHVDIQIANDSNQRLENPIRGGLKIWR